RRSPSATRGRRAADRSTSWSCPTAPSSGAGSERIVDPREDLEALVTPADVDEGEDLRAHDAAEAEPVVPVQVADRVRPHALEHLARVDEGRQLELRVHAEQPALVHVGPELE